MHHKIVSKSVIIENKCIVIQINFVSLCYKIAGRNKAIKLIKNPLSLIQTSTPDDVIEGILFTKLKIQNEYIYRKISKSNF